MNQESKKLFFWPVLLSFTVLALTGCPKKQTVKKEEPEEVIEEVQSDELDIHGKDFAASKYVSVIHFDYDSTELSAEARKLLSENGAYLKKNNELEILTEGHCDDRGTIAYNLALGEKRADAVRKYYVSLGIDAKRIGTLSYGKEKPDCMEANEECWAKNRRVETKIRVLNMTDNGKKEKKE